MEFIYHGASIECDSAEIISRDIKLSSFVEIPNIGRCRKYNCKRNSESTILEELNPKKAKYKETSHLNIGDNIAGEDLFFLINTVKNVKVEVINLTGRHKAQKTITKCYTYAEITQQFPNITELKDPKQIPPQPKQLQNGK